MKLQGRQGPRAGAVLVAQQARRAPQVRGTGGSIPPEQELESTYGAPVATGRFVWVANPTSGRVAYIDAQSYAIRVVEAGNAPTVLAAVPSSGGDIAIVLNKLSLDATVLRAGEDGSLSTASIAAPAGGNTWAISNDGRWAVAWSDARLASNPDPVDGFQDLTVLDLTSGNEKSWVLTVGYRPVALAFDASSKQAFAVTQDGVTVISLEGTPAVVRNIPLSDSIDDSSVGRDVSITPDGSYALVRREGVASITAVALASGTRTELAMPGPVTDLDLSVAGDVAVAVIRDTSQVAILPIPGAIGSADQISTVAIDEGVVGSVSLASQSSTALLYSNAVVSEILTALPLDGSPARSIKLRAPVLSVFPTPDAKHAIVLHSGAGVGSQYPSALSVVPIEAQLPARIEGLDAYPLSVAIAPDGTRALVATSDEALQKYKLHVASMPSLAVDSIELASPPIAVGIVAGAKRGFVAQRYADGRITFVDLVSGEARTLTGFELAAQVVDGGGK
ncbi:MAG: hypothetical protein U0165_02460 [Polyangiaceae bacterium]